MVADLPDDDPPERIIFGPGQRAKGSVNKS